jgi:hypothetical protein
VRCRSSIIAICRGSVPSTWGRRWIGSSSPGGLVTSEYHACISQRAADPPNHAESRGAISASKQARTCGASGARTPG